MMLALMMTEAAPTPCSGRLPHQQHFVEVIGLVLPSGGPTMMRSPGAAASIAFWSASLVELSAVTGVGALPPT